MAPQLPNGLKCDRTWFRVLLLLNFDFDFDARDFFEESVFRRWFVNIDWSAEFLSIVELDSCEVLRAFVNLPTLCLRLPKKFRVIGRG